MVTTSEFQAHQADRLEPREKVSGNPSVNSRADLPTAPLRTLPPGGQCECRPSRAVPGPSEVFRQQGTAAGQG